MKGSSMRCALLVAALLGTSACTTRIEPPIEGSVATDSLERYECGEAPPDGPPYFHLMEMPDWDYPSWSWSPDGRYIVYQRLKEAKQQIYALEVETGRDYCLSDGGVHEGMPNWSPDGERIVLVAERDGLFRIVTRELETGVTTDLVAADRDVLFPSYSPSGRHLAFIEIESDDAWARTLRVLDLESGDERVLAESRGWMGSQQWSLDGRRLYFHQITDSGWNDIIEVAIDGGEARNTTRNTRADSWSAAFSPDSRQMLFTHGVTQALHGRYENTEILRKDLETLENRRLTWAWHPDDGARYSPDGESIVFQGIRDGYREFYRMRASGSGLERLTHQPATELTSTFRRHGYTAARDLYTRLTAVDSGARLFSERGMESLIDSHLEAIPEDEANWLAGVFLQTYPDSVVAFKTRGRVRLRTGDRDGALADFLEALGRDAMLPDVWRELGTQDFLELLDQQPSLYVSQGGSLNALGYEMLHLGDGTGAARLFARVAAANPEAWNIFDSLAEAHMWLGHYDLAIANYEKSLDLNPDNTNAEFHLGRIRGLGGTER